MCVKKRERERETEYEWVKEGVYHMKERLIVRLVNHSSISQVLGKVPTWPVTWSKYMIQTDVLYS